MIDVKVEYPIPGMVIQSARLSTYSKFEFRFLAESGSVNNVYYWYGFETVAYPALFPMNAVTYIFIRPRLHAIVDLRYVSVLQYTIIAVLCYSQIHKSVINSNLVFNIS